MENMLRSSILTALVVSICAKTVVGIRTLELVQIVWRHGDRTPVTTYPTDPNDPSIWPQGFGQLTERGMRQHQMLGDLIRRTYIVNDTSNFGLKPKYTRNQIYVRCTDVDRTLQSAYANLYGMFPHGNANVTYPADGHAWPATWSPIPVHTVSENLDYLLNTGAPCAAADHAQEHFYRTSPEVLGNETLYKPFFDYLKRQLNLSAEQSLNTRDIWSLYDCIYIARNWNNTAGVNVHWPSWVDKKSIFDRHRTNWQLIAMLNYLSSYWFFKPRKVAHLRGGSLLTAINELMASKVRCIDNSASECDFVRPLKYIAYSAHDTTVLALLRTLRDAEKVVHLDESGLPRYAAAVAVELWRDGQAFDVKINYHDGIFYSSRHLAPSTDTWRVITRTVTGCSNTSDYCPLERFIHRSRYYRVENYEEWQKLCKASKTETMSLTNLHTVTVCGAATVVLLMFVVVLLLWRTHRQRTGTIKHTKLKLIES